MKQSPTFSPENAHPRAAQAGQGPTRLTGPDRRAQVLRTATEQFAVTGLHATTTLALAKAAGISEPILYAHFGGKEDLFREAVEKNLENRLAQLSRSMKSIPQGSLAESVEKIAEATMSACISPAGNAALMAWALLEVPDHAAGLYRAEIASIAALWDRELAERFPASRQRATVSIHLVPYAVSACASYGVWLAVMRHTPETAAALAKQFAAGIAQAAAGLFSGDGDPGPVRPR